MKNVTHLHIALRLLTVERFHFDLVVCMSLQIAASKACVCNADSLSAFVS